VFRRLVYADSFVIFRQVNVHPTRFAAAF